MGVANSYEQELLDSETFEDYLIRITTELARLGYSYLEIEKVIRQKRVEQTKLMREILSEQ